MRQHAFLIPDHTGFPIVMDFDSQKWRVGCTHAIRTLHFPRQACCKADLAPAAIDRLLCRHVKQQFDGLVGSTALRILPEVMPSMT